MKSKKTNPFVTEESQKSNESKVTNFKPYGKKIQIKMLIIQIDFHTMSYLIRCRHNQPN